MRDVIVFHGGPGPGVRAGGPFLGGPGPGGETETEPLALGAAVAAAAQSVRLAWSAKPAAVVAVAVLNAATSAADLAQSLWSGDALESAVAGERARSQVPRLVALGALKLGIVAGRDASNALKSQISRVVGREAESKVLDVVAAMELADIEDPGFQDRLQQALMACMRQSNLIATALGLTGDVAALVIAAAAVGTEDPTLIPLAVAGAIPQWVLTRRIEDPMRAMRRRSREGREGAMLRHLLTNPANAHELRAFGSIGYLRTRHDDLVTQADAEIAKIDRDNRRRGLAVNLTANAGVVPAAGRLLLRLAGKQTSLSGSVSSGLAARKLTQGISRLVGDVNNVRQTAAVTNAYDEFVNEVRPAPASPAGAGRGPRPSRDFERIVVRGLDFTYRGGSKQVLHGVDLEIRRGEVVALVGENGSGKTTLAKLLCALYQPTGGTIHWDDVDTAACDPAAVRANIAVVFQDFVRYPLLTAAENIGIGMPSRMHDREAIVDAARRAGAHDVIAALPDGYDTKMSRGFGGGDISTGQWQRVALARAFLRDAPLVVLDEPTAALDPRAERDLFATVASLYRSRSALLISHRLSSVRFADRICVLAEGRIIESGTHDALLAAGGTYAELFELQAHAYR